jgi:hypothetical protein
MTFVWQRTGSLTRPFWWPNTGKNGAANRSIRGLNGQEANFVTQAKHSIAYPGQALRCMSDASLVEIATHLEGLPKHYFLVRTKENLHFSMANIGESPFPGCTQADPEADKQPPLLPSTR